MDFSCYARLARQACKMQQGGHGGKLEINRPIYDQSIAECFRKINKFAKFELVSEYFSIVSVEIKVHF